jgi:hypothetical protein
MAKPMIDPEALITLFEHASAKQGAQLRDGVTQATLAALQARELTLKNIRGTLKQVSEAASAGAAKNLGAGVDPQSLLEQAVAGMDAALLKAVDANRVALQTLVQQGADLREKHLKKALDDMDHFEDTMFATLKKTAANAGAPLAGAWGQVLEKMQAGGTQSGAQATAAMEQLAEQMQSTLRSTRAASMRAAQAMAESYTAMVSGVLIGMSDALQGKAAAAPAPASAAAKKATRR